MIALSTLQQQLKFTVAVIVAELNRFEAEYRPSSYKRNLLGDSPLVTLVSILLLFFIYNVYFKYKSIFGALNPSTRVAIDFLVGLGSIFVPGTLAKATVRITLLNRQCRLVQSAESLYSVLGVERTATHEEIRKAYRAKGGNFCCSANESVNMASGQG